MPRGPKAKPKAAPRQPLKPEPPREMRGRARAIYRDLAADLVAEGFACAMDWRTVALAAQTAAHAERLEGEVEDLPSLFLSGPKSDRVHPLVVELRAVRAQLAAMYGSLLLTPRARSSARMSADMMRTAPPSDELDEFLKNG